MVVDASIVSQENIFRLSMKFSTKKEDIVLSITKFRNDYLSKVIKSNRDTKSWFESELEKIKIKTRPSEGNFSFVEMSDEEAKKIFAHLANSGIIVRQLDSYGLPNCLRITIGTREEMEATINSLKGL